MSVVAYCTRLKSNIGTFDKYVKPPRDAVCSTQSSAVHRLTLSSDKIKTANTIEIVWPQFTAFIEGLLDNKKRKGIIVAWGGQACDCEWLFYVTEESHRGTLYMPKWCLYFLILKQ